VTKVHDYGLLSIALNFGRAERVKGARRRQHRLFY
jgi:hypothetical protein